MLDSRISSLEDKMASAFSLCYDYMSDMNNRNMQILDLMKNLQQTQAQILKQLSQQQQQSQFNQPQMMPTPLIVLEKDDQKETKKMDGKKDEKKDTKNTLTPQKFTGRPSKSYSDFSDLREMESKEMKTPKRWSEYVQTSGVDVSNLSKVFFFFFLPKRIRIRIFFILFFFHFNSLINRPNHSQININSWNKIVKK
mgnify:CR=1 FL=1